MDEPIDLADAARRLRQWQERLDRALRDGDQEKADLAHRLVVNYTLLLADLQRFHGELTQAGATIARTPTSNDN
jgi:hypothetical protein